MVIVMVTGDFLSMSLTTDNVRPSPTPNAWRIGRLTVAGVSMGICLLAFCTGILAAGRFGMHLGLEALRTLAFIVLVFGSQATIYAIRERRHLWGSRPSLLLAVSTVADIAVASTLAVGGIAMAPLPVLLVTGTLAAAVLFAFILDLVKVPVLARLGIAQSPRSRPMTQVTQGMAKKKGITMTEPSAGQPEASDSKPEAKAEPKSDAIAGLNSAAKAEAKDEAKAKPSRDTKAEIKPAVKVEPKREAKEQPQRETTAVPMSEMTTEPRTEIHGETPSDVPPGLVKRVHELYEELGRQDVQAVQDWEKAQGEIQKEHSAK
jgi:hypothetical protein